MSVPFWRRRLLGWFFLRGEFGAFIIVGPGIEPGIGGLDGSDVLFRQCSAGAPDGVGLARGLLASAPSSPSRHTPLVTQAPTDRQFAFEDYLGCRESTLISGERFIALTIGEIALSEKGIEKLVPSYQARHWSM
jgi:hypothetical protein